MFRVICYSEKRLNEDIGFLSYIYSELFKQQGINFYDVITIELSNDEEEEYRVFGTNTKRLFVFKKFNADTYYGINDDAEKKMFLLSIFKQTTREIARRDNRINILQLDSIEKLILDYDFEFAFVRHSVFNKQRNRSVSLIVKPLISYFEFYLEASQGTETGCDVLIYRGKPSDYYLDDLFFSGKWKAQNEYVLKGRRSEVEFHFFVDSCVVDLINVSANQADTPIFNMFKFGAGEGELRAYIDSLNPDLASAMRRARRRQDK